MPVVLVRLLITPLSPSDMFNKLYHPYIKACLLKVSFLGLVSFSFISFNFIFFPSLLLSNLDSTPGYSLKILLETAVLLTLQTKTLFILKYRGGNGHFNIKQVWFCGLDGSR